MSFFVNLFIKRNSSLSQSIILISKTKQNPGNFSVIIQKSMQNAVVGVKLRNECFFLEDNQTNESIISKCTTIKYSNLNSELILNHY